MNFLLLDIGNTSIAYSITKNGKVTDIHRVENQENINKFMKLFVVLIEYLELHGYESFAHACWDSMRKRFKAGRIEKFEEKVAKDFDLNEEWESARARFSEVFPIRRTLEQLKAKREETNGE